MLLLLLKGYWWAAWWPYSTWFLAVPELSAFELAGKNEGSTEIDVVLLEIAAINLVHFADRRADDARGAEHRVHGVEVALRIFAVEPLTDEADHPLRQRKVASGEQREEALPRLLEGERLAEG